MSGDIKSTFTASTIVVTFALIAFFVWCLVLELAHPIQAVDCNGIIADLEKIVNDTSVSQAAHDMSVMDLRDMRATCGQG